ncbi:MAG: PAS domain S-box protein, partial [Balneolaceae bacterium]|nr:PAS domain S-box protein [Balneolaceae bacterium]
MNRKFEQLRTLSPLSITLIYFVAAGLWILLTDYVLHVALSDGSILNQFQTYKGLLFVCLTSLGLYLLINKYSELLLGQEQKLKGVRNELHSEKELIDILFEKIPVFITIYDPGLEDFEVNWEFEKVTGWTNEDAQKLDLFKECFPDKDVREKVVSFMRNPGIGWKEFPLQTKSGEILETSWTNIRLTDETSVGIGIDMTETKASEARLEESRELLENVFESLEEGVILVNPETRTISDCNKATEQIFGYKREELTGKSTRILHLDEEHFKKFDKIGAEALKEEGVFQTEYKMKKKNGEAFYSEHTVKLVKNNEGEVDRVVSVVRDITDRKIFEKELKKRQARLLRSQEIGNLGDWEFMPERGQIFWSPMMYRIYEKDPKSFHPSFDEIKDMYLGDDYEKHQEVVQRAIESGESFDIDLKLKTGRGNRKFIRAIGLPEKNEEGEVKKIVGTVQDITERKKYEIERKKLSDILEKSQNEIYLFDAETLQFEFVNKGALENIGYSREEILQMSPLDIKPEFDLKSFRNLLQPILDGDKEKIIFETIQKRKDGTTYDVEVHAQVVESGRKPLIAVIVLDITDRKQFERKLRANEQRLKNITNNIPGVVFQYKINPDGTDSLQYVSKGADRIWGVS